MNAASYKNITLKVKQLTFWNIDNLYLIIGGLLGSSSFGFLYYYIIDRKCEEETSFELEEENNIILIAVKTHDDKLDRVVMEVLKDVTRDDLNDEAHDIHIYFKPVGPFSMYKSAIKLS